MDNGEQRPRTPLTLLNNLYYFMYFALINQQITWEEWNIVKDHINGLRETYNNIKK